MTFMSETLNQALPIWNACLETPFVQEVKSGVLPLAKFKNYMIQDSIYLKHYARVYGKAIYHSTSLQEIQQFYSVLCFVNDTESAVRLSYLEKFGMTDHDIEGIAPLEENRQYIDFLLANAEEGDLGKILMAVLPCMLSYSYIFHKLAKEPQARESAYWNFIEDYADERYVASCKIWSDFADEKCGVLPAARKQELTAIFIRASLLELDFWKMAYRE